MKDGSYIISIMSDKAKAKELAKHGKVVLSGKDIDPSLQNKYAVLCNLGETAENSTVIIYDADKEAQQVLQGKSIRYQNETIVMSQVDVCSNGGKDSRLSTLQNSRGAGHDIHPEFAFSKEQQYKKHLFSNEEIMLVLLTFTVASSVGCWMAISYLQMSFESALMVGGGTGAIVTGLDLTILYFLNSRSSSAELGIN